MYCSFFGFSSKPFDVTPDPAFLYLSPTHREMLATLIYGIRERRGIIAVIGEVGTGKTTLLHTLLSRLDDSTSVAYICNTGVTFDEMLALMLFHLKLARSDEPLTKAERLHRLHEFALRKLSTGGNVVLLVDEAQNLNRYHLENLRLVSNFETTKHKLVQIVLSGQPELDAKLNHPGLRQLAQRIALKRYITPLSKRETYQYIQFRLHIAGYDGPPLFSHQARKMVWDCSGGIPRKINILCDNALLIAYALRRKTIRVRLIKEAITDLTWSPFSGATDAHPERNRIIHAPMTAEDSPLPTGPPSECGAGNPVQPSRTPAEDIVAYLASKSNHILLSHASTPPFLFNGKPLPRGESQSPEGETGESSTGFRSPEG